MFVVAILIVFRNWVASGLKLYWILPFSLTFWQMIFFIFAMVNSIFKISMAHEGITFTSLVDSCSHAQLR
jgi:hypothetical protein